MLPPQSICVCESQAMHVSAGGSPYKIPHSTECSLFKNPNLKQCLIKSYICMAKQQLNLLNNFSMDHEWNRTDRWQTTLWRNV